MTRSAVAPRAKQDDLLEAVARRLVEEPSIAATLELLAHPDSAPEPARASKAVALARQVNEHRLAQRRDAFRAHALTTSQVQALLGGVSRQAVALRVAGGGLLALELGGRSYFPDWQFDDDGVVPGLRSLLDLLRRDGRGVLAADALMRAPIDEESGRTAADLLAAGDLERARHYVALAGS